MKAFDPSDASPKESFPTTMCHSLYSGMFVEESTPVIVPNTFDACLTNVGCDQIQSGVILQSTVCEGTKQLTSLFLDTNPVDSSSSRKLEESNLLNCQPVSV